MYKATLWLTPADFVEELRLDEARWLLEDGNDPIVLTKTRTVLKTPWFAWGALLAARLSKRERSR